MANPSRSLKGIEKGRGKPFHDEVKRGDAMTDDGENAQGRYTLLKWCPCSEHQVPGSEAERRVLDCGQWWTTGGQFCRRGCGGDGGARAELGAGKAERQRGRVKWGAQRG